MAKKLRIGIVGCGGIFNWAHIYAYQESDKLEAVAFCDIVLSKAEASAEKLGVDKSHCYEDFKEMIEKEEEFEKKWKAYLW